MFFADVLFHRNAGFVNIFTYVSIDIFKPSDTAVLKVRPAKFFDVVLELS